MLATLAGRAQAQAPAWQLAVAATHGPGSTSCVYGSATDATGNVYLTGMFTGTITFGSTSLTSLGDNDVFITKWDNAARAFAWARQAGGLARDQATSIAVSGTSVYVAGMFASPTATLGTTVLTNANFTAGYAAFVAKLTDAGTFIWAQAGANTGSQACSAVAAVGNAIYLTGHFAGATAGFGSFSLTNAGPTNTFDGFVAKLTDAGTTASFAWAQRFGGADYEYASSLVVRGTSVYLAGVFASTAAFGSLALTSAGMGDAFVAKLTDAGNSASFAWAERAGGLGSDYADALTVSNTNVYIGGSFEAATGLGATATFGSITLSSPAYGDEFIAKLTDAGNSVGFTWAKQAGNFYTAPLGRIQALKSSGSNVYVLGWFFGTTQAFGSTSLASAGAHDIFLTKLVDTGPTATTAWVQQAGGAGEDYSYALAIGNGTVYAVGSTQPVSTFGSQVIGSAAGSTVGFLAAMADASALASRPMATASLGISLYPNPTSSTTTVQLPAGLAAGPVAFTVLDAVGRVVRVRTALVATGTAQATLDVTGLAPGLYTLRVAAGERLGTARLLVE